MNNDNNLIRRGDVIDCLEHRVSTVSHFELLTKAINAIPAVSSEPFGLVSDKNDFILLDMYVKQSHY